MKINTIKTDFSFLFFPDSSKHSSNNVFFWHGYLATHVCENQVKLVRQKLYLAFRQVST